MKIKNNNFSSIKNGGLKFETKRNLELSFLAFPAVFLIIVLKYLPIGGLVMAFQDFKFNAGFLGSKFVGFENFKFLFLSGDFIRITRNSILYNLAFIFFGTLFSVIVALLLNEVKSANRIKVYQTSMLLPYVLSMVIVSYVTYGFLSTDLGICNKMLKVLGLPPINWYTEKRYWPFIILLVNIWKGFGYSSIVFYASLLGIDATYYEAAKIDGASRIKLITKISIPLIKPIIIVMVLMNIGKIFYSDFALFYVVPKNSTVLYPVTDVIDTYVYRALKNMDNVGMGAAAGFYQSVVGCILVSISNYLVKKYDMSQGLF